MQGIIKNTKMKQCRWKLTILGQKHLISKIYLHLMSNKTFWEDHNFKICHEILYFIKILIRKNQSQYLKTSPSLNQYIMNKHYINILQKETSKVEMFFVPYQTFGN